MADATTTRYGIVKPEVGASADTWGTKCNQDFDDLDAIGGAIITTGSGAAYVLTTGLSLAAYVAGQSFLINPSFTCNAAATVNVDGLGAKNITKNGTTATVSGDIASGRIRRITYDGTQFQTNVSQSEDATTTALAALSWSSGNALLQFTAADTVSLTLAPSVTDLTLSGVLTMPNGSVSAVAIRQAANAGTGLYFPTTNQVGISINGTNRLFISSTVVSSSVPFGAPDGTVSAPGQTFSGDTDNGWYRIGTNNWAGAVGGSKFVDIAATLVAFSLPVQGRLALSSETTGTLTVVSANKKILASGGITLPNSVFAAEDTVLIDGNGTARTITRGSGVTMYVGGVDSATATLTANGIMAVNWRTASVCVLTGNVS